MKLSYVSFVITHFSVDFIELQKVDEVLEKIAKNHEIILVVEEGFKSDSLKLNCPITVIYVRADARHDLSSLAALTRAAGDFIFWWDIPLGDANSENLELMMNHALEQNELVRLVSKDFSWVTNLVSWAMRNFGQLSHPVFPHSAVLFSRRSLEEFIEKMSRSNYPSEFILSELHFEQMIYKRDLVNRSQYRVGVPLRLIAKGTRLGVFAPLLLSFFSILFSLVVTIFALITYISSATIPQGWTSLMIFIGITQGFVFSFLGLIWARLDSYVRGIGRPLDPTLRLEVLPS